MSKLFSSLLLAGALAVGLTAAPAAEAQLNIGSGVIIDNIDVDPADIAYNPATGLLTIAEGTISGTIAGLPFETDIVNFALQLVPGVIPDGGTCSVLDLELGPIDLSLLGLNVNTSRICLEVTAIQGGGVLGDLLCGLAGGDLDLLDGLPAVLSAVLTDALASATPPPAGAADVCEGECEILDLALGPVDLTLLGLNVLLDDCEGGPVLLCVSASAGEGLLGDLLCGLAGGGILPDLGNLEGLIGAVTDGLDLDLSDKELRKLVNEVGRALRDGELTTKELDKLTKSVAKLVRKA